MKKILYNSTACYIIFYSSLCFAAENPQNIEDTDSWSSKSVFQRSRPEYTRQDAYFGSFKFSPSAEMSEIYNSNIYATENSAKSDFITKINPGVKIESDWQRNAVALITTGDIGRYANSSSENYSDYSIGASTRLDLLAETYLLASAQTAQKHEDRGSPDSNANAKNPTKYTQNDATISFIRSLRRMSFKIDDTYTEYKFENSVAGDGSLIENNDRNRTENKTTFRVGYEIMPEYEAFIRSSVNQRNYVFASDVNGFNRDSSGYEAEFGTALNLGGKTKGEIFAGYMGQNYTDDKLRDINGMQFGGNVLWNATKLTSIKASIIRGIEETTQDNSSGFVSTLYSLEVEHELLYNLLLGVDISYNTNDYIDTNAISRLDNLSGAGTNVKYLLSPNSTITARYDYTRRDSNQPNQNYDRNMVTLGVKLEM